VAAITGSAPLLFAGFFVFGAGNAGKLAARYAAVDLATFETRGRCPECSKQWQRTACLRCGEWSPHESWYDQKRV